MTSIDIPNSVTSIGSWAFYGCENIETVFNRSSLTFTKGSTGNGYIAYYASLVVNNYDDIVGDYIWAKNNDTYCLYAYLGNDTEIVLPETYKDSNYIIGDGAFSGCIGLTSITIPNSITSIGSSAFRGCSVLEEVHIADLSHWCSIEFKDEYSNPLYNGCGLYLNGQQITELTIPYDLEQVKSYTFINCKGISSVAISNNIIEIGASAFSGCEDVEMLYISSEIKSIADYAFFNCSNIMEIKMGSQKAIVASENIFSEDTYNNACLYVPNGRKFAYEKTAPWNKFYIAEIDLTVIEDVFDNKAISNEYYDLNGRIVKNPVKGIYIKNGKKVYVK